MRAIDSAVAVSRATDRPLTVLWTLDRELNCRFDRLFDPRALTIVLRTIDLFDPLGRLRYALGVRISRARARPYRDADNHRLRTEGHDFRRRGDRTLYYHTCRPFMTRPVPFEGFEPAPTLRPAIEAHRRPGQVGVHIRRSDNANATNHSPTGLFIEQMEREVRGDGEIRFFVATDSPEEERVLRDRFPGRIHSHRKRSLDRSRPEAAEDAVVDLFALASCDRLIGSYWSSFTDVAASLGGKPRVIVDAERTSSING